MQRSPSRRDWAAGGRSVCAVRATCKVGGGYRSTLELGGQDGTGQDMTKAWADYRYVHIGEVRFIRSCKNALELVERGEILSKHPQQQRPRGTKPTPALTLALAHALAFQRQTPTRTGPGLGPCHVTLGSLVHRDCVCVLRCWETRRDIEGRLHLHGQKKNKRHPCVCCWRDVYSVDAH